MCVRISFAASWKAILTCYAILVVPASIEAWILLILEDLRTLLCIILITATYLISIWLHELMHTISYIWFAGYSASAPLAQGTWRRARISRKSLGLLADAVISAAAPLTGLLCLMPAIALSNVIPETNFLFICPWMLLFLTHIYALAPWQADGAQVFVYLLKRKAPYVDR